MLERIGFEFQCIEHITQDGFPIKIYLNRKKTKETILVFNPICVSIGLVVPLLNMLSEFYQVVTWESRGTYIPTDPSIIRKDNLSVNSHLSDMKNILSILGISRIDHAIGFCSGCKIACLAKDILKEFYIKSLSLVSPTMIFDGMDKSSYQASISDIIDMVVEKGPGTTPLIKNALAHSPKFSSTNRRSLNSINSAPFRHEDSILMYAYFYHDINSYDQYEMSREIGIRLFIMNAKNDLTVNPDTASYIHKINLNSTLLTEKKGGHFILCHNSLMVEAVLYFINNYEKYPLRIKPLHLYDYSYVKRKPKLK